MATLIAALLASVLTVVPPTGTTGQASAAVAADFDPGYIVSDAQFYDGDAMTAAQVQSFIDARNAGCLAGYTCLDTYAQATPAMAADAYCDAMTGRANESAASIIARVGAACDISQRFLVVLLEKEQSLVTHRSPSASRYLKATGFGCPDTAPCDSSVGGFFYQIYYGARQFNRYAAHPGNYNHRAGVVNQVLFNPNAACGSSPVLIRNNATAGLYNYTPYQPNAAALANLYGTGDGCSAYGNRNTWRIWTDWFGDPTEGKQADVAPALARDTTDGRIYLLGGGRKHHVPNTSVLLQFSALGAAAARSSAELAAIPTGPAVGRVVISEEGSVYLVERSRLHHFQSCAQMVSWGIACDSIPQLDAAHRALMVDMGALNSLVRTETGANWLVQYGTRRQVANTALLPQWGFSATPSEVGAAAIGMYAIGQPVVADGDLVRSADASQTRAIGTEGRVYTASAAQQGLGFVQRAVPFEAESLRLIPATAGSIPSRFRDSAGAWVVADGGALRVDAAQWGGEGYFTPVNDDLRRSLPAAGTATAPAFARTAGSDAVYFMASGLATLTTPRTFEWYATTFNVPRTVWVLASDAIEPIPQPTSYADGTLIRSPQGGIYLMDGGNALHVTDMRFVVDLGLPLNVIGVSSGIMAGLQSQTGFLDSNIIRMGDRSYVAVRGNLHPFASEDVRRAWSAPEVTLRSAGSLVPISPMPATAFINDTAGNVFVMQDGKRRPVTSIAALVEIGGATAPRLTMNEAMLAHIPLGAPIVATPAPGTLLRTEGRSEVWLYDGERRLHLGSFSTSIAMGLGYTSTWLDATSIAALPEAGRLTSSLISCGTQSYAAVGGELRPLSAAVRSAYPASAFTAVSPRLCERLDISTTPMSQFLRGDDGKIYYVEGGVRHWLGGAALTRLGGWNSIVGVDRTIIDAIPAGATWSS
ncbi:hypothetical protein [Agrococcus beijingensis]|uniref:hypothetical protein n=1 Tax=Agrococcus beijingensis TaxID=3068634 RepID=UPI002741E4BF|nr:hypothetical protein [Agrococcus sp. REN33]